MAKRSKKDRDVHVVGYPKSGHACRWQVVYRGERLMCWRTQDMAITHGRDEAKDRKCDLVVHARDGKIRLKDSHGNDPRGRKG